MSKTGRYNTIIENDVVNGEGICVSFFVQGCPHRCSGCFNEETWDFRKGLPYTKETKQKIINAIKANNIIRNFSVLGGEPLAPQNLKMTEDVITTVRILYPNITIFLWTGYDFTKLQSTNNKKIQHIFEQINVIIDGKFIETKKDLNLKLRGSSNQIVWRKKNGKWEKGSDN